MYILSQHNAYNNKKNIINQKYFTVVTFKIIFGRIRGLTLTFTYFLFYSRGGREVLYDKFLIVLH